MTERHFIHIRENFWNEFEALLKTRKQEFRLRAAEFPQLLRSLTGDLNTAKAHGFDPAIVERLNRLLLDGNQKLCAVRTFSFLAPVTFFAQDFPRAVRSHWRSLGASMLLFYGLFFFTMMLCIHNDNFVHRIIGAETAYQLEEMYDKESAHYLKPREVTGDADMFAFYIYNNVSIAFRIFAGGLLAGVGSLLLLIFNAVFLGAATAYMMNIGLSETFFSFTSAHSAFELNGFVLSAQAGLVLGYSFFVTKGLSRIESLKKTGKAVSPIIAGAAILIFLAAIIEAFWSSRHDIPPFAHYASGAAAWIFLVFYLVLCGRGKKHSKEKN
ncbi:MAG: stage II sporulation protein M [Spirochaetaceae bacterium]|jgi:uncharacterized membrane protein SpoIIM required for sporulation|nr:stage II sporulation protein M [Spirochaetaceae bacterium]